MPRFLAPITVANEYVTGNETISGIQTVIGATSGRDSYWTTVSIQSGLSADYANFVNNVSALAFYGDGSHLTGLTASGGIATDSSKLPLSGGTISGNLTITGTFSTIDTDKWSSTYSTVCANSAKWESVYSNVNSNSATYVTLTGTQTLKNKTVVDWMTLVRGYNTTPNLSATIPTGEVYTYVYTSSPSDITYYRYIATDGTADAFYTYFSGTTLSGLVASKSIIL